MTKLLITAKDGKQMLMELNRISPTECYMDVEWDSADRPNAVERWMKGKFLQTELLVANKLNQQWYSNKIVPLDVVHPNSIAKLGSGVRRGDWRKVNYIAYYPTIIISHSLGLLCQPSVPSTILRYS